MVQNERSHSEDNSETDSKGDGEDVEDVALVPVQNADTASVSVRCSPF